MYKIRVYPSTSHHITVGITENNREKVYFLNDKEADELIEKLTSLKRNLESLKQGNCFHCGKRLFKDDEVYTLDNSGLVHRSCIYEFLNTDNCFLLTLPSTYKKLL